MSTAPDSAEDKLLKISEEAIEREQLSQQRYALGASVITGPAVKKMFLRLPEDDMSHQKILRERLVGLRGKEGS